jgi:hypothetical protein
MAPIGGPEHANIQQDGRDVIKDEGKRVLVTGEVEAVAGLTGD